MICICFVVSSEVWEPDSSSSIFLFIVNTLMGGSEKMLLLFMSERVWPMFSSKSLIVSGLISRSLIHLEFLFVYGVSRMF